MQNQKTLQEDAKKLKDPEANKLLDEIDKNKGLKKPVKKLLNKLKDRVFYLLKNKELWIKK